MDNSKEILFFFSALGVFNGLILSCYFLLANKKKYLSNYFLGALLFALSIRIGKSVFLYFNPELPKIYLQIGLSACFLIGPFLYYFIKSIVEQKKAAPKNWKKTLIVLILFILIIGIIFPYQTYPKFWNQYFVKFIYTEWLVYIVASGIKLKSIIKRKFLKTDKSIKPFENWLLTIFLGNVIIFISYALSLVIKFYPIYISGSITFSFILYIVIFIFLYRKKTDNIFSSTPNKYANKKANGDANIIVEKLYKIMDEEKLFQNPNLTLNELANSINISGHQLSQLLNENMGKNFTTFINEYRINEACNIIVSDNRLTLEGIGYQVGFNSKSTFFSTFKKLKGTTPLLYQQNGAK